MSTSGVYNFSITRDNIIRDAMLNIGRLASGEMPTPEEISDCSYKLNTMVKQWQADFDFAPGLRAWTRTRADLVLSSNKGVYYLGPTGDNWMGGLSSNPNLNYARSVLTTATAGGSAILTVGVGNTGVFTANDYAVVQLTNGDTFSSTVQSINAGAGTITLNNTLPSNANSGNYVWNYTTKDPRPSKILNVLLRDNNLNDTPISEMTLETYELLPSKVSPTYLSDPSMFYYEPQLGNGVIYFDMYGALDVTKTVHIVYYREIQDFVNPSDNPEFSKEWYDALGWGLSKRICPMFQSTWTQEMEDNFQDSLMIARRANRAKTEIYFVPYR
jgi:hypothetical protein